MPTANFYPGPSRIYSGISEYIYEAIRLDIMSINHRSEAFMELMADTKEELHKKLRIPRKYEIAFVSSATESWEIISQSLVKKASQHYYNGAFGEKWFKYAKSIKEAKGTSFGPNDVIPIESVDTKFDTICLTQNETSNGTQIRHKFLEKIKKKNPDSLITVDATSSMGGINLDFELADYWYASVQKCFGLPAGLGIILLSPRAVQRAEELGEDDHYNSLLNILRNTRKNQTHYTPNVLNIFLLLNTQRKSKSIDQVSRKTLKRSKFYGEVFSDCKSITPFITNDEVRSDTVLTISHQKPEKVHRRAGESNIVLGKGYGDLKSSTFRIANFPAIKTSEIEKLMHFMQKHIG